MASNDKINLKGLGYRLSPFFIEGRAMEKDKDLKNLMSYAEKYSINLADKRILIVSVMEGNTYCREVEFRKNNFKHLTGVDSHIKANNFIEMLIDKRLSNKDWNYKKDGTTELKLRVFPEILDIYKQARMIGVYNGNRIKLSTDLCVGNIYCYLGIASFKKYDKNENTIYFPNTVISSNIKTDTNKQERIVAMFRKNKKDSKYKELTYLAKDVDLNQLKTYIKEYVCLGKQL